MYVEALNGTDGIPCEWMQNGKNSELDALAWEFALIDGMELDPTKDVLEIDPNKYVDGMEIVPPPCTNVGVYMVVALVIDPMLPAVVIEGKCVK